MLFEMSSSQAASKLTDSDCAFCDPPQVTLLIGMSDELATEDFCTVIFDEFFFTALAKENVVQQLGKLLWHTHAKLPAARRP